MTKKILIACDSFKGSLTSQQVGDAVAKAVKGTLPDVKYEIIPIADGGEGTVDALVGALQGRLMEETVTGPLGNPVKARYAICGDTAIIEVAEASGLTLVPENERNPMLTTTYGTGELIRLAINKGCKKFLIGLGGSATNDAGTGMLRALGFRFLDSYGAEVTGGGGEIGKIVSIDASDLITGLDEISFTVACDVTNPLCGLLGASRVFGPQKGADEDMVKLLDDSLHSFARTVTSTLGYDYSTLPGAGAAGGLGFAFLSFLRGKLEPGIEMILNAIDFDQKLADTALVITGEGRLDRQTCMGKAPAGILKRCKKFGVPVIAIGGSVSPSAVTDLMDAGFAAIFPIIPEPVDLAKALQPKYAVRNIERTVTQILRILSFNQTLSQSY